VCALKSPQVISHINVQLKTVSEIYTIDLDDEAGAEL
jgi:hypothetical protein